MKKFAHMMTLFVAIFMVVQPVIACCAMGHDAAHDAQAAPAPPCHGDMNHRSDSNNDLTPDHNCPGCSDCGLVSFKAQTTETRAAITVSPLEIGDAASNAHFGGFVSKPTVLITGPPKLPLFVHATPISLKQRLLI
jgi:hypothetical protein